MASDDLGDALAAFNAEYRQGLPERVAGIDALWAQLRDGAVSRETLHALLRGLHGIAGSAGTFGLAALGAAAAAAEAWIEPFYERVDMPDETGCAHFDRLLEAVRQAAR